MPTVASPSFVPTLRSLIALTLSAVLAVGTSAQNPAEAEMYYKHRLVDDAKRTAIQALFQTTDAEVKLRCKDLLARIAMDEDRASDAVELWQDIAKNHPNTPTAATATQLLQQWSTLASTAQAPAPSNARTATWFRAAAFWVGDLPRQPHIDTAWLDVSEAAEFWLRKIVAEYPGTPDAEEALASIVRLHLGSEGTEPNRGHGASSTRSQTRSRPSFEEHMGKAEAALGELKTAFPKSPEVPRLQFLTAHVYWLAGDEARSRPWLIKVSEEAKVETLWSQLARLRLKNWRS